MSSPLYRDNDGNGNPDNPASTSTSKSWRSSLVAFYVNSGLAISFLVFLNAAQPFVLADILELPKERLGKVSGWVGSSQARLSQSQRRVE